MKKRIIATLLLGVVLCTSAFAADGFTRSSQHLFSLGYGMSIKNADEGTVYCGGPIFDRTWVEAYNTDAPFGVYYSVDVKLNTHIKYNDGNWATFDLKTNTQLAVLDIIGLGFPFQIGKTLELTFGIGLSARGTLYLDFTGQKFFEVFPYVDLYMGVGARADAIFNLTNSLFIDLSAAIDYEIIGAYVDGRSLDQGRRDGVLFPLDAKATLGVRF